MQMQTPPGQQTEGVIIRVDRDCDVVVRVRGQEITPELRAKMDEVAAIVRGAVKDGK